MRINTREELEARRKEYAASLKTQKKQILICAGTGCVAGGSLNIYARHCYVFFNGFRIDTSAVFQRHTGLLFVERNIFLSEYLCKAAGNPDGAGNQMCPETGKRTP